MQTSAALFDSPVFSRYAGGLSLNTSCDMSGRKLLWFGCCGNQVRACAVCALSGWHHTFHDVDSSEKQRDEGGGNETPQGSEDPVRERKLLFSDGSPPSERITWYLSVVFNDLFNHHCIIFTAAPLYECRFSLFYSITNIVTLLVVSCK